MVLVLIVRFYIWVLGGGSFVWFVYYCLVIFFDFVLFYFVVVVFGVVVCCLLKLLFMLGYLVVGVVIGLNVLVFVYDLVSICYLVEFGVVFLMFVIGLEFNLFKLCVLCMVVFGFGMV